ncbi:MAG: DUF4936 family protein [Pseudomonadota bacterium]
MPALDLYVYYRVREADAPVLQGKVRAMQAALTDQYGVAGQLKRRPEPSDGLQTWMEVYPATEPGFLDALDAAATQAGLSSYIDGARHAEVFTDVLTCA